MVPLAILAAWVAVGLAITTSIIALDLYEGRFNDWVEVCIALFIVTWIWPVALYSLVEDHMER